MIILWYYTTQTIRKQYTSTARSYLTDQSSCNTHQPYIWCIPYRNFRQSKKIWMNTLYTSTVQSLILIAVFRDENYVISYSTTSVYSISCCVNNIDWWLKKSTGYYQLYGYYQLALLRFFHNTWPLLMCKIIIETSLADWISSLV